MALRYALLELCQSDLIRPVHRPTAISREAMIMDPDGVDIQRSACPLPGSSPPVDPSIKTALADCLVADVTWCDAQGRPELLDLGGAGVGRLGRAAVVAVFEPAGAGFLAETPGFGQGVQPVVLGACAGWASRWPSPIRQRTSGPARSPMANGPMGGPKSWLARSTWDGVAPSLTGATACAWR